MRLSSSSSRRFSRFRMPPGSVMRAPTGVSRRRRKCQLCRTSAPSPLGVARRAGVFCPFRRPPRGPVHALGAADADEGERLRIGQSDRLDPRESCMCFVEIPRRLPAGHGPCAVARQDRIAGPFEAREITLEITRKLLNVKNNSMRLSELGRLCDELGKIGELVSDRELVRVYELREIGPG